jgi:BlaI family penicillinase repressor
MQFRLARRHEVLNFLHMPPRADEPLPRREREAMDILHRLGEGSVSQVQEQMSGEPSYSAVRALLGLLVEKDMARSRKDPASRQYLYAAAVPVQRARRGALGRLLDTFFGGSPSELVATLLSENERDLSTDELTRIREMVDAHSRKKKPAKRRPAP